MNTTLNFETVLRKTLVRDKIINYHEGYNGKKKL